MRKMTKVAAKKIVAKKVTMTEIRKRGEYVGEDLADHEAGTVEPCTPCEDFIEAILQEGGQMDEKTADMVNSAPDPDRAYDVYLDGVTRGAKKIAREVCHKGLMWGEEVDCDE